MVIGAKIFITEETEIIGNDERARTELYLYSLCRARRRKTIVKINGKGYVFRIKYYFWNNYDNYDNFFQNYK